MAFAWSPTHFGTLDTFRQYLKGRPVPWWAEGATIHHTVIPVPAKWHGLQTMTAIGTYYRQTLGWSAGPHLFLCLGAPNRANDGIFLGTPLNTQGVHAGACNSNRYGIELVGNYDDAPWPVDLKELAYGVVLALGEWAGFDVSNTLGHRECLPNKSCPGKAIDMRQVRQELLERVVPPWRRAWGALPMNEEFGIPTLYKRLYQQGVHLGAAETQEEPYHSGTIQRFTRGIMTWTPAGGVRAFEEVQR